MESNGALSYSLFRKATQLAKEIGFPLIEKNLPYVLDLLAEHDWPIRFIEKTSNSSGKAFLAIYIANPSTWPNDDASSDTSIKLYEDNIGLHSFNKNCAISSVSLASRYWKIFESLLDECTRLGVKASSIDNSRFLELLNEKKVNESQMALNFDKPSDEIYEPYIRGEHFKSLRPLAYKKDGGICLGCGRSLEGIIWHLHHLLPHGYWGLRTYGYSFLYEVICLCESCHALQHPDKNL